MKSKSKCQTTKELIKRSSNKKNAATCTSTSSTSYSCVSEEQYIFPKMSSLLTHKSLIGARYNREFWTDELLNKLYYYIPNDRYWDKFNLDDLDENIKLKKLKKSIEDCLITPKEFAYTFDEFSNLAATTETVATATGTTQTPSIAAETVSAKTSNVTTDNITERIKNDIEIKKKFLQCIGSYPDKKLRKHFYKLLKWKELNVTDYDNREYFNQILESTIKKCKSNIAKKKYDEMHMMIKDQILERLDMKNIPKIELEEQKKIYDEKCYQDTSCEDKMRRGFFKMSNDMKDQFKSGTQSKGTNLKDKESYMHQSYKKDQIKNALFDSKSKGTVDQKRPDRGKGGITQRNAKNKPITGSKSNSSKRSKFEMKLNHDQTTDKMEDLKMKIDELNYMKTSKTGATCKLDPMSQIIVKDEHVNYSTVSDGVTLMKDEETDINQRENVKQIIKEINKVKNNEVISDLLESDQVEMGNFIGIKPELDQTNDETNERYDEAKKKIVTILKILKGVGKNRQLSLESKKIDPNLNVNSRKFMGCFHKNKVLNWFKQKDYLKQTKIKKTEMKLFMKDDHMNLLKRILNENRSINTFLEHRWDIVGYLSDNVKEDSPPQENEPSTTKLSTVKASEIDISYETGTSDDEVRAKISDAGQTYRTPRPSRMSRKSDRRSRFSSIRRSRRSTDSSFTRDTIVYDISEPDDFRDLDDWEEFMEVIVAETKQMKAEEPIAGIMTISKDEIRYVLRPESKRTSLPDFIYEMFETGLLPDAQEVEEELKLFKKKVAEKVESEEISEECVLEKIESDFVVRKQIDRRLELLFENFDKARNEYAKDNAEDYNYNRNVIEWQIIQRRLQQQKLLEEREARSRSFRTLPSSGSSKDDEPCYINDLKRIVGPKLKKAITDVLMVRPQENPIEYMVGMLHHYSNDEQYENYMNEIDRELLTIYDDLFVNRNYGPRRFKIVKDAVIDSDSPYPTDSETSFDSELLEDRDVHDIIEECKKPKPYDLSFLKADVISSVSMTSSSSDISISSILSVTTGMTVGSSIASMSVKEPSNLEIYDDDIEEVGICNAGYVMNLSNPPPINIVDGNVIFNIAKYATPMMDLFSPQPFDMGYNDILINNVNNVNEPIDLGLDELLKIEENRQCPLSQTTFGIPSGPSDTSKYPRGYAMDPNDPPPLDMGYDDILINEVNNEEEPTDIDSDEILQTAEIIENEVETRMPQISQDDISDNE
ncbi:hypothetical protein O3M35_010456 [Rhynocoris fuscipes]|uniref:Uncharacterized protein n=1 Tax=Rhynocoris fuscipes TaxID=488301 RepID=A0AAW1D535_9HEMI